MSEWTPKPRLDAKIEDMSLTGEEGFVLSRIDGATSFRALVNVTGLPEGRVRQILQKLVRQGAVEDHAPSPAAAVPGGSLAPGPQRSPSAGPRLETRPAPIAGGGAGSGAEAATVVDELSPEELAEILDGVHTMDEPLGETTATDGLAAVPAGDPGVDDARPDPDSGTEAADASRGDVPLDAAAEEFPRGGEDDAPDDVLDDAPDDAPDDVPDDVPDREPGEELDEAAEANHRRLYNETLAKLEAPLRESMAKSAREPELSAFCFDPLPAVIKAVLENNATGFQQARLIARHHHTPQGLDFVMARAEFFRDGQTQRLLLQNTMLQEPQIKKLLQTRRLADVFKVTISREIPERNRQKARHVLRHKWSVAEAEERAGLVFQTEGRCLLQLTGLPFDSRTTSMLCAKTYTSNLLIQNLARFGATPPPVLAHLLKQQAVRRQTMLKNLVLQHPNCPADAKRKA